MASGSMWQEDLDEAPASARTASSPRLEQPAGPESSQPQASDFIPPGSLTGEISLYDDTTQQSPFGLTGRDSAPAPLRSGGGGSSSSNGGSSSRSVYDNRREFERAVNYATPAIEEAMCLASPEAAATVRTCVDARGELTLSYDDWFKLRGLLLCARFGACEEKWPPYYDNRALRHWQAWKAQGSLPAKEARQQFVQAVTKMPGYAEHGAAYAPIACFIVVCPCAWPCRLNICGIVAIRFERPPPRTPTLEEAEASRRRALQKLQGTRGPPGTLESFVGRWRHLQTEGIDEYLKAFGVGVIRRKAAKVSTALRARASEREIVHRRGRYGA